METQPTKQSAPQARQGLNPLLGLFAVGILLAAALGIFYANNARTVQTTASASVVSEPASVSNPVRVFDTADNVPDRTALETARVQAVIGYLQAHHQLPAQNGAFDSARQVVMDFIRTHNRFPTSAAEVDPAMESVLEYIRVYHALPPQTQPMDPAVQDLMDYIRVHNTVPSSIHTGE